MTFDHKATVALPLGEGVLTLTLQTNGIAHSVVGDLNEADQQDIRDTLRYANAHVVDVLKRATRTT